MNTRCQCSLYNFVQYMLSKHLAAQTPKTWNFRPKFGGFAIETLLGLLALLLGARTLLRAPGRTTRNKVRYGTRFATNGASQAIGTSSPSEAQQSAERLGRGGREWLFGERKMVPWIFSGHGFFGQLAGWNGQEFHVLSRYRKSKEAAVCRDLGDLGCVRAMRTRRQCLHLKYTHARLLDRRNKIKGTNEHR